MRHLSRPLQLASAGLAILFALAPASGSSGSASLVAQTSTSGSWTVYHGDPAGTGVAAFVSQVNTSAPVWTSPKLDGQIYGEPLAASGQVYVATENDTVYDLSSSNGAVKWSMHVGNPVPSRLLPCGDITPMVGITGTPVIDPSRDEIFVVADTLKNGGPSHVLFGLNITDGAIELTQSVDPPGSVPSALLQRTGLALDAGQVVFGMGGNYGDCASYRGRVIAVDEAGGTPRYFTVDAATGDSQGAIWMGGAAPVIDAGGDIWVSAGNGSVYSASQPYDDSDSALELSSSLALMQYFAPSTWPQNNARDLDMSTAPALLSDGQVVLAGKSRIAYLLNGSHLGGIGGQEGSLASVCNEDVDGGMAYVGTTIYLPCLSGTVAINASGTNSLHLLWRSNVGGGPPIVAAGSVWTIGQNGVMYALDPSTGQVQRTVSVGEQANHFPTPSVGDGLLLAPSADQVMAFSAASAPATTAPSSTTSSSTPTSSTAVPAHSGPVRRSGGGLPAAAVGAIFLGSIVVIGAAAWLTRRQRKVGHPHR
jgi:outer membrane protein assembly factor BamB